jgi:hypothetical protein
VKTKHILFDGESALRSKVAQEKIKKALDITVYADPYWKRSLAERYIREVKLRMVILLDMKGKNLPPPLNNCLTVVYPLPKKVIHRGLTTRFCGRCWFFLIFQWLLLEQAFQSFLKIIMRA